MNVLNNNQLFEYLYVHAREINAKQINHSTQRHSIKHEYSIAFPCTAYRKNEHADSLFIKTLGLINHTGIIPFHYLETIINLKHQQKHALGEFFDLFLARLINHSYSAWLKNRPIRQHRNNSNPYYHKVIKSLIGSNTSNTQTHQFSVQQFSRLYTSATKNCACLESIITLYTQKRARVEENVGQWIEIDQSQKNPIGSEQKQPALGGLNYRIGTQLWDRQRHIRIHIGPLNLVELHQYLHNQAFISQLHQQIRSYLPQPLTYDIQFIIAKDNIKPIQIGNTNKASLGFTTWLYSKPLSRDQNNIILGEPHGPS